MDRFKEIEFKRIAISIVDQAASDCKRKVLLINLIQQALIDVSMQRQDESGKIIANIKKDKK